MLTAVHNSGYRSPQGRTTINLAPADVKKEGPSFDLPSALGTIAVGEEIRLPDLDQYAFVGELALDGAVRGVNGVLPIALEARRKGRHAIMVPEKNAHDAAIVSGITTYGVLNLRQVFEFLRGNDHSLTPVTTEPIEEVYPDHEVDFADVRGQYAAKLGNKRSFIKIRTIPLSISSLPVTVSSLQALTAPKSRNISGANVHFELRKP